ncbi:MAG: DUF4303 domain-containing protein [Zavarzinella sp.]
MINNKLSAFLNEGFGGLLTAVISDIKQHIVSLRESGVSFYGYAAMPPDYATEFDPTSFAVAFNCESDIDEENKKKPYYRYSVDEWQNYVHDGFEATNAELKSILSEFKTLTKQQDDDGAVEYLAPSINKTLLNALMSLRNDGTFEGIAYVVIWISDSSDEIINQSAKSLNSAEVYDEYASEFC